MSLSKAETSKAEKSKEEEDDLAASISKSMTVDKLKNALTKNRIVYSAAKKKADFVDLYISNGLHNGSALSAKAEAISLKKEEAKEEDAVAALLNLKSASLPVTNLPKDVENVIVLEELIMSITIMGHGCEDLLTPWTPDQPISLYFRNNVRVYSKACVPDVNAIGNIYQNEDIIKDVQRRFSAVPNSETSAIISTYADEVKREYMKDIIYSKATKAEISLQPNFDKLSTPENIARVSGLSTYLSNKHFSFYQDDPKKKLTQAYQHLYKSLGLQVTDIRLKKTALNGTVSYEQIFSPLGTKVNKSGISNLPFERTDISNHNLIYREGLTYILKNVLKRKELVKPALQIFGFKGSKNRIMDLTLEQIYEFLQLLGVKYANLMDYSCRACSIGRIPQGLTDRIYSIEQQYSVKPVAFGKRSSNLKGKRSDGKRLSRKIKHKAPKHKTPRHK
jgi:hypothetical protein